MIKAIETIYNGYRFRSRLEARWAVFFDVAKIKYEYEPEGFRTNDGTMYLPDFYLPDLDAYVEVKRNTFDGAEEVKNKCEKVVKYAGPVRRLVILSDVPEGKSIDGGLWHYPALYLFDCDVRWGWWFFYDSGPLDWESIKDSYVVGAISKTWTDNSAWKRVGFYHNLAAISDQELRPGKFKKEKLDQEIRCQEYFNELTFKALKEARKARFEHGE